MTPGLLDIYILSLLERGLETPYQLQREGGLSLGASTPSLRRLSQARLVRRKDENGITNRPRHVYTLTTPGRDLAKNGWRNYLYASSIPNDLDAVLRLAEMATYYGASSKEVIQLLKRASEDRTSLSRLAAATRSTGQTLSYQRMRTICDESRWRGEAQALTRLAASVVEPRPRKKRKSAGGSSPR
jgi:DNA-binding PadR family transcriptional regulator